MFNPLHLGYSKILQLLLLVLRHYSVISGSITKLPKRFREHIVLTENILLSTIFNVCIFHLASYLIGNYLYIVAARNSPAIDNRLRLLVQLVVLYEFE